jgi:hypothetical protein
VEADHERRTATATVLGRWPRTAVYRPGLGCTLAIDVPPAELRARLESLPLPRAEHPADLPWPAGRAASDPAQVPGLDAAALGDAVAGAFEEPDPDAPRNTRAVAVAYAGRLVAERYAPGFGPQMRMPGWSMTKAVSAALAGVLVGRGLLDRDASPPVPQWREPGDPRSAITVDHLLRMTTGLDFSEAYFNPLSDVVTMLFARPGAGAYAASRPLESEPGAQWSYISGATNILQLAMREALVRAGGGEAAYLALPRVALFEPLGMDGAVMEPDATGVFVGSSYMLATARDWARFGLFLLQDGVWEGQRLLPRGWVEYMRRVTPQSEGMYGAGVWTNGGEVAPEDRWLPKLPPDTYSAWGFEGQYVTVVPSAELVVVRLGMGDWPDWSQEDFVSEILAALPATPPAGNQISEAAP